MEDNKKRPEKITPPTSTEETEASPAKNTLAQPILSQGLDKTPESTSSIAFEEEFKRNDSTMQNQIPVGKSGSRKSAIKVALIIVLCLPLIGVGLLALGIGGLGFACNQRTTNLERYASNVGKKIDSMGIDMSEKSYGANGDCLTGSGAYFNFTVNKSYPSPLEAKNDIVIRASRVGLAAPQPTQEPQYLFAQDGNISGGNTPIRQIEATYYLENSDNYTFLFELDEPIPCEVLSYDEVICAGKSKDALLQELVNTLPIQKVKVSGNISSNQ